MSKDKKRKKRGDNIILRTLQGRIVSGDFFRKNIFYTLAIVVMFIIFMSTKYQGKTQREEIIKLTKELNSAKSECVKYSSEYNSMIRESAMRQMVLSKGVDLESPDKPAYNIKD